MNDLNAKEVSDICVACGMCCDGTLFEKGNIVDELDKKNIEELGIEIIKVKNGFAFKQPCNKFNSCCTIYDKKRPRVCNTFFCKPLKRVKNGEIDLQTAEYQIYKTLNIKNELVKTYKNTEEFRLFELFDFRKKMDEILEKSDSVQLKKYGILVVKTLAFQNAVKSYFRAEKKDSLP